MLKSTTADFDLPQQLLNSSDKVFERCRFLCSIRNYISNMSASISQYDDKANERLVIETNEHSRTGQRLGRLIHMRVERKSMCVCDGLCPVCGHCRVAN